MSTTADQQGDISSRFLVQRHVHVPDVPSWTVRVDSTVEETRRRESDPVLYRFPAVRAHVLCSGKPVTSAESLRTELLSRSWSQHLSDYAGSIVSILRGRHVPVPEDFPRSFFQVLAEERVGALRLLVRSQASVLVEHIQSAEACQIWCEEEARHVLNA